MWNYVNKIEKEGQEGEGGKIWDTSRIEDKVREGRMGE